ncbi:MAG TPA: hypothetical protein VM533_07685 [Fimbriiglobus sp.]|jgi:hypothetical protein|nr:hypothetical protein [Fimbriiglobus sp.]
MRKFVLAGVALFFTVGLVLAAEVSFVKYDKETKELTVKDKDEKETTYKISEKVTFKTKDKDGNEKEMSNEKGVERLEKIKEGSKQKFDVEADGKKLKSLTFRAGKGKKKAE